MDSYREGRLARGYVVAGLLAAGLCACGQLSMEGQGKLAQHPTSADIQRKQDKAAALSDAAIPRGTQPPLEWNGYPPLKAGPDSSASALVDQVHALARSLRSYADAEPGLVEKALAVALPSDAEGRRRGIAGRAGTSSYTWAVWRRSPSSAGNSIQLSLDPPDACLDFEALKAPLVAEGFEIYVPTFGDDDRITFYKPVESSLTLFVAVSVDQRAAPTCARTVMLELEPSDASQASG